jgi:hypothetical protein
MGMENLSTPQATFQLSMTMSVSLEKHVRVQWWYERYSKKVVEGSLEVKLPTIWTDEKQSRAEAERRGRGEERRSEDKE